MRIEMRLSRLPSAMGPAVLLTCLAWPVMGAEETARSGVDFSALDKAVRPQDDFFRYVNGLWIARTTIPADRSAFGSFFALRDASESNLRAIIEEAAADAKAPAGSDLRK